jgi:DNA-directed RNA polymerase specialized sigma24 family protein
LKKEYYILVNGKKCAVSKEVFKVHRKYNNALWYSEYAKKSEKITIDEAGKVTITLSAEDSLERLTDINREFPDKGVSIEGYIETKMMIDYALSCLPPADRKFIELHYYKGYSMEALAEIRQIPLSSLYRKRNAILCKLNEILESE